MEGKDQPVFGAGELPPFIVNSPTTLLDAFDNSDAPSNNNALDQRDKGVALNVPMVSEGHKPSPFLTKSLIINEPEVSSRVSARSDRLVTLDAAVEDELKRAGEINHNLDTKKLRRTVSNRLSAQRSRLKRSQYINELEQKINELQDHIGMMLYPMVDMYKQKRSSLVLEKNVLEQRLYNYIAQSKISDMEIEEKNREVTMLRELQKAQKEQEQEQEMINDDSFFAKFQTAVLEGSNLEHYTGLETQEDMATLSDQFLNFDGMNAQPPNNSPF